MDLQTNQPVHEVTLVKSSQSDQTITKKQKLEFLAKADFTYDLDITVLNGENLIGGYKSNWTASWESLASAKDVTFHVLSKENADEEAMFELFLGLEQNSLYSPKPEFS